ncbi:MAG TPA: PHP domain-containing protein [Chloroflexota bacterium]|nr:PHP domain-containing protein [Chloroflexota bacterium]
MSETSRVDLHLHTTVSDGYLTPRELVRRAHANGVRTLAVTDHDNTDGLAEARAEAAALGLTLIPGIELSTDLGPVGVHILGYFLRYDDPGFQARLAPMRDDRLNRAYGMVARLGELGYPISIERVLEIAGEGSVGRPHIAQALLEAGHVGSIAEAFDRFIADHGPAYVERMKLTPQDAIALIHAYGGVASVAHPYDAPDVDGLIAELVAAGLDGIETYYQGYGPERVEHLLALTRQYGLVPTGGSDYHGFPMGDAQEVDNDVGSVPVPEETVALLRARAG